MELRRNPSFKTGFARNQSESANPNLWQGLVGAWVPSMGPTGSRLLDLSGYRNHAVITATMSGLWQVSSGRWSIDLDGSPECVDLSASSSGIPRQLKMGTGSFSVVASIKRVGAQINNSRLFCVGSVVNRYEVYFTTGATNFSVDDNTTKTDCTYSYQVSTSSFDKFVFVHNKRADTLAIYLNGQKEQEVTNNTNTSIDEDTSAFIGSIGGSSFYWVGQISSFLIYKRALSPAEIMQFNTDENALFLPRLRGGVRVPTSTFQPAWATSATQVSGVYV